MKHVRLTVHAPEDAVHPVFDMLTRSNHVERVRGLHWNVSGDRLGILHYVEGDVDAYLDALTDIPEVLGHDVAVADDDAFYVYHRCVLNRGAKTLFETFTRGGLLLVPPVEFGSDGTSTFSLLGTSAEVQDAIDGVPDAIDVDVEAVGGIAATPQVEDAALSDRQREAVEAALAIGYYDVPREASHEDVADAIDCAPSTAAEHLRKAESKLLRSVVG